MSCHFWGAGGTPMVEVTRLGGVKKSTASNHVLLVVHTLWVLPHYDFRSVGGFFCFLLFRFVCG